MRPVRLTCSATVLAAALFAMVGCSDDPPMGEVAGTVKIDGEIPPEGSSISFIPADGAAPTAGATLDQGRYSVKVPIGTNKVEIRAPRPMRKPGPATKGPGAEGPGGGGLIEEMLPARFNNDTELRYQVKEGKNPKDWNLSTK